MVQKAKEENSLADKAQDFLTGMAWWKEEENVDDIEIEDLTGEAVVEEDQSFLGSAVDFLKNVDYKQLAEESIPIVGENIIIGDIKENLKEGSLGSAALNTGALALGTVPIIGDLAAKPLRALASKYQKARKKVDNIESKEEWQKQIETLKTEERATTGRDPTGRTLDLEEQAGKFIDETKESQLNTYTFKAKVTAPTRQGGKAKMAKSGLSFDVPIRARTEEEARILLRQHPEVVKRKKRIDEREIPMDETAKSRLVVDEVYMTGFSDDAIIDAGLDTVENVKAKQKARRAAYIDEVQKKRPITEWKELPHETTDKALVFSLNDGQIKNGSFILPERMATKLGVSTAKIKEGAKVMGRLDIPAYKRYDTWIVTNTVAGQKGSVYSKGLHYTSKGDAPISFRASQAQGEKIGTGQADKIGYATIVGSYKSTSPEQIRKLAQKYLNDPKWTQVGFDPRKLGSFYTRNLKGNYPVGTSVTGADEVLQLGPLVLAKNVKVDLDYVGYNEGGPVMALEEQTEMAFGDQPPRIDPVSGNEVPPGALPSEVRDDIPARLSEGEYVVPADVLQYYGIKFFEDLRSKAKTKLAGLEEDGRMGGEPMDDASMEGMEEMPFNLDELKTYEDDAEGGVQGFYEGGITSGVAPDTAVKTYINAEGSRLYIRFVNGIAIPPVPPGYVEEGVGEDATPVVDPVADAEQRRLERERNEDPEKDQSIWDGTKPPIRMTTGELAMAMAIHSGGGKIKADFLPGIAIAKGAMKLLGGSRSMSDILLKEANRRVAKAEELGLNPTEISVVKNLAGLDPKKINTWRNTISLAVDKGGAATTLNKFSDIFKGRGNTTRTGTGIIDFTDFDQGEQIQKMSREMAIADQKAREKAQVQIDKYKDSEQSVLEQVEENREEQQEETEKQEETFQAEKTAAKTEEAPTSSGSAYSGSSGGRREFGMNKGGLASKRKIKKGKVNEK